jgi:hypothetical protein
MCYRGAVHRSHRSWLLPLVAASACGRFGFATKDNVSVDANVLCISAISHDDDGDGVNDDCDLCPGIAEAAQGDRDHDGVGDLCDPDPDNRRHTIALFDSGVDTSLWSPDSSATVNGDCIVLASSGDQVLWPQTSDDVDIEIEGVIDSVDGAAARRQLFIGSKEQLPIGPRLWYGEIIDDGPGLQTAQVIRSDDAGYFQYNFLSVTEPFAVGPFRMHLTLRTKGSIALNATMGTQEFKAVGVASDYVRSNNRIQLVSQGISLRVRSLFIVATQP